MINDAHIKKSPKGVLQFVATVAALTSLVIPVRIIAVEVVEFAAQRARSAAYGESKPLPPEWAETIKQLKSFVETERGLKFKHEVPVVLETKEEFRDRLAAEAEGYDRPAAADSYIALKALHLVDRKLDLDSLEDPLEDGGTVGYYDSISNRLVVEGEKPTPFVRAVLVHELTHALQDQNFDLDRNLEESDESYLAFRSVVEGDAMRMQHKYLESLTSEEQAEAASEEAEGATYLPNNPSIKTLFMLSSFPYEFGEQFVNEVFEFGGQTRVDQAFRSPPTTTEQLLHPKRYLSLERPSEVDSPDADGEVFEEGVWGELGLLTTFLPTLPEEQAREAAEGWRGDYYVAWKKAGKECIRMNIVTDEVADKNQLVQALRDWADKHTAAAVTSGKMIQVRACS